MATPSSLGFTQSEKREIKGREGREASAPHGKGQQRRPGGLSARSEELYQLLTRGQG